MDGKGKGMWQSRREADGRKVSDLIPVGKRFKLHPASIFEHSIWSEVKTKRHCCLFQTKIMKNFQASDSGVGSHSPSPDLASDGEESPRNKRFEFCLKDDEDVRNHKKCKNH